MGEPFGPGYSGLRFATVLRSSALPLHIPFAAALSPAALPFLICFTFTPLSNSFIDTGFFIFVSKLKIIKCQLRISH